MKKTILLSILLTILGSKSWAVTNPTGILDGSQYSWVASLSISNPNLPTRNCTGVLIASQWVLTAAHCIPTNSTVYLTLGNKFELSGKAYYVDAYQVNGNFTDSSDTLGSGDIALLHLQNPAPGPFASLPPKNDINYLSGKMYSMGYGESSGNAVNSSLNYSLAYSLGYQNINSYAVQDDQHIFTKYQDPVTKLYSSICFGDSGGPLVAGAENPIVVGVASKLFVDCKGDYPQVYTRVSAYLDWIRAAQNSITTNLQNSFNQNLIPRVLSADGEIFLLPIGNKSTGKYTLTCKIPGFSDVSQNSNELNFALSYNLKTTNCIIVDTSSGVVKNSGYFYISNTDPGENVNSTLNLYNINQSNGLSFSFDKLKNITFTTVILSDQSGSSYTFTLNSANILASYQSSVGAYANCAPQLMTTEDKINLHISNFCFNHGANLTITFRRALLETTASKNYYT